MSDRERTPQQVDPVGALASRPVSLITVLAALVVAVSATLSGRDEIVDPAASVGAVAALAAAGFVLVLSASPLRAPFRRRSLVAVVVLSCAAVAALSILYELLRVSQRALDERIARALALSAAAVGDVKATGGGSDSPAGSRVSLVAPTSESGLLPRHMLSRAPRTGCAAVSHCLLTRSRRLNFASPSGRQSPSRRALCVRSYMARPFSSRSS